MKDVTAIEEIPDDFAGGVNAIGICSLRTWHVNGRNGVIAVAHKPMLRLASTWHATKV